MPRQQDRLKKRALSLIESVARLGATQAAQRRHLAEAARVLAVEAGDLILEAEALLSLSLARAPLAHPNQVLAALKRAGQIFVANGLHQRAARCRIASAAALTDAGEETASIRLAEQALQVPDLPAEDQVHAHLVIVQGLLNIGEIDAALYRIDLVAPLATASSCASLVARIQWMRALAHAFLLMVRECPDLWYALPSQPAPQAAAVNPERILAWLDEAQRHLQPEAPWHYIDLCRDLVQALFLRQEAAATRLLERSALHTENDPPLALRSLLCLALVRRAEQRHRDVLPLLTTGQAQAQRVGLKGISRSMHLHLAKVFEVLGDAPQALAAFKRHAALVVLSLRSRCDDDPFADGAEGGDATDLARDMAPSLQHDTALLRNLEPAYLRKAIRFVEDRLVESLRVTDVASHCGVSRRTLEVAFKAFKSTTVAEFIAVRKMERAATALLRTDLSVKDVAAAVGYRSASGFSREFRARLGARPTEWRRARRDTDPTSD